MRFTTIAAIVVSAVNASYVAGFEKARSAATAQVITVTGCVERAGRAFRLTETSGAEAPAARSWKTVFLKKRPSDLDAVDHSSRTKLSEHVGHRDALTGTVRNGEMRVQRVRHLAASCGR